jgi:hypothetical protein
VSGARAPPVPSAGEYSQIEDPVQIGYAATWSSRVLELAVWRDFGTETWSIPSWIANPSSGLMPWVFDSA